MSSWIEFRTSDLINDGLLEIGDGYRAKNSELGKYGLPFVRVSNINNGFHFENADRFPEENLGKVGAKVSAPGDVVFTSKGTVGRYALVPDSLEPFVYSPQLCYWRSLNWDVIDPHFLYYWMHGREFWVQVRGLKGQTDMADYVSLRDQRRMLITMPAIEEQRLISAVLGAFDDKIELNRQMNATLEEMARAIFKSWFVDFDPVRAKARGEEAYGMGAETAALFPDRFEVVNGREVPVGWEVHPLDEIARFQNGLALQKYPPENEEYLPVVKIRELRQGSVDVKSDQASPNIKPSCVITDGDVVFSWSGSLLVDVWTGGRGALNQHLFKVTSDQYPRWFYYYWTKYHLEEFQRIAAGKATTMGHIKRRHLTEANTIVPTVQLLTIANRLVSPLLDRFVSNNLESRTLAKLRDTLLPQLMSGKIRILP